MKNNVKILSIIAIAVAAFALLMTSCQTVPEEIPDGLSQQEFFQRAQEYMDNLNYDAALFYLQEFSNRFPDDIANQLAADYQIALIHYKTKKYDVAAGEFQAILDTYDAAPDNTYPEWISILSAKLLDKIQNMES